MPPSFDGMFAEITDDDDLKTRYNDYNYVITPSVKIPGTIGDSVNKD